VSVSQSIIFVIVSETFDKNQQKPQQTQKH